MVGKEISIELIADFKGVLGNNVLMSLLKDAKDQCLRYRAEEKMKCTVCVVCVYVCEMCAQCACAQCVCVCEL